MLDTKLIGFLEGKAPDESYNYSDSKCCAAAQFNQAVGREYPVFSAIEDRDDKSTFDGKLESVAYDRPWNFGAMLERARKEFA